MPPEVSGSSLTQKGTFILQEMGKNLKKNCIFNPRGAMDWKTAPMYTRRKWCIYFEKTKDLIQQVKQING
jgi:hypothetical protein